MNICGVLVHSRPEAVESVRRQLESLEGVEVHGTAEDGRMVVTVEAEEGRLVLDQLTRMRDIEGVLDAALVYHYDEQQDTELQSLEEVTS
ncbi:MAG: hypothetical protein D6786_03925 [Gammaproteobacteria bacterium]|nr:MAG: hypothetical protein D6786_03925 [Gammaproteobacteria bacterium]